MAAAICLAGYRAWVGGAEREWLHRLVPAGMGKPQELTSPFQLHMPQVLAFVVATGNTVL